MIKVAKQNWSGKSSQYVLLQKFMTVFLLNNRFTPAGTKIEHKTTPRTMSPSQISDDR